MKSLALCALIAVAVAAPASDWHPTDPKKPWHMPTDTISAEVVAPAPPQQDSKHSTVATPVEPLSPADVAIEPMPTKRPFWKPTGPNDPGHPAEGIIWRSTTVEQRDFPADPKKPFHPPNQLPPPTAVERDEEEVAGPYWTIISADPTRPWVKVPMLEAFGAELEPAPADPTPSLVQPRHVGTVVEDEAEGPAGPDVTIVPEADPEQWFTIPWNELVPSPEPKEPEMHIEGS